MSKRVEAAVATYALHRWNATAQKCACGEFFPATLQGHADHKRHRMEKVLEASDQAIEATFCDQCNGPYLDHHLEAYGGHWDTCPNRAKAILPEENFEEMFGD